MQIIEWEEKKFSYGIFFKQRQDRKELRLFHVEKVVFRTFLVSCRQGKIVTVEIISETKFPSV